MTDAPVTGIDVFGWTIPTDEPESDGTLEWDSTTIIVVEVSSGDVTGLGWTYTDSSAAALIDNTLKGVVAGMDALSPNAIWEAMRRRLRNIGQPGIGSMAVSAVDMAIWDLKARLLEIPLVDLLGRQRSAVPVYGSGGFTSYRVDQLRQQLSGWVETGMRWVKMKVGRDSNADPARVAGVREAIGNDAGLFVDANGAYGRKEAVDMAYRFAEENVIWLEEPVSSDNRPGLAFVRKRMPPGVEVTAGEYAFTVHDVIDLIDAEAVDVIQLDVTRCGGITGLLAAAEVAHSRHVPLSTHTAPQAHLHPAAAIAGLRHIEWFHDHVRIESRLFEGTVEPREGKLSPDPGTPGTGLSLRQSEIPEHRIV